MDHNSLTGALEFVYTFPSCHCLIVQVFLFVSTIYDPGEIPKSLGALSALTMLTMSQNQLTGSIPEGLGDLPLLTMLMLSNNQLSGSFYDT